MSFVSGFVLTIPHWKMEGDGGIEPNRLFVRSEMFLSIILISHENWCARLESNQFPTIYEMAARSLSFGSVKLEGCVRFKLTPIPSQGMMRITTLTTQ